MDDAMVTGRMSAEKKEAGNRVLERAGLNASQAVNMLYDRLIKDQNASVIGMGRATKEDWEKAVRIVDSVYIPIDPKFDNMTRGEIKLARYEARCKAKGL